ncbi:MAG TPA: tetratricopeptide repeat protein [Acidobacteriaceae bacterium]|nr:tetratricopeptide repeat protein [Acidobacteriaceae bacterium]
MLPRRPSRAAALLVLALSLMAAAPAQSIQSLEQAASAAREAGNADEAIRDYSRIVALRPDSAEDWWNLGATQYQANRYADAVTSLRKLTQLAPNAAQGWDMLGLSQFETKNYDAAVASLEKARSLGGKNEDPEIARVAAYHLALLLTRSGDFQKATALLHQTFGGSPSAQVKTALGLALLRVPLLPSEVDPSYDALIQAAGEAAVSADSTQALATLVQQYPQIAEAEAAPKSGKPFRDPHMIALFAANAATTAGSENASAWQTAMRDYSAGKYPEAIAALKTWVEQNPNDGTAWAVMGLSEFALKDYGNARIHLQRGIHLGLKVSAEARQLASDRLALLLIRDHQFDAATSLLRPLAGHPPMAKQIQLALGLALLRIPSLPDVLDAQQHDLAQSAGAIVELLLASRYSEAFPAFEKLIAEHPSTPWLHYAYGNALDSLSRYDDAKAQMHAELKLSPRSALPWISIAAISLRQHLPAGALNAAQTAVDLASTSAEAHYQLGRAWLENGDTAKAIAELAKANAIKPDTPEIHFVLARAYSKAGEREKAAAERAAFTRLKALEGQAQGQSILRADETDAH